MDEKLEMRNDLAQVIRLALSERTEDVRLFTARLLRKYRQSDPELAEQLDGSLRRRPASASGVLRSGAESEASSQVPPVDDESRLALLRLFQDEPDREPPVLGEQVEATLNQLIEERQQMRHLASLGLSPTRSAIFVGRPGVGKTLTARWLAARLGVPLYVLDLTAVMSSLLGRSGTNLRAALDFAKRTNCVLLLDEIDAIAKRRSDDADVGELKRLVTVILQEVDDWPETGLLLAATNYPELIDPALWRRFDLIVEFKMPDDRAIGEAVRRFFGPDTSTFGPSVETLEIALRGKSFSDIEKEIQRMRRVVALGRATAQDVVTDSIRAQASDLSRQERMELAIRLHSNGTMSQHVISAITNVSRDTIRKHTNTLIASTKKAARKRVNT